MQVWHMVKRLTHGLVAIAAVLFLTVGGLAQQPATIYGLAIPDQVGGLSHGAVADFESKAPGLGYSLRFLRSNWTVDVYIYDFQLKLIPADLESPTMQNQIARAKGDIFKLEGRGVYSSVEQTEEFKVGDVGKTPFACSAFSYARGDKKDQESESYLCLTSWNNKFVKIRMTAAKGEMSRADLTNFVEAWISLLSSRG
jgi:hypothetical protein